MAMLVVGFLHAGIRRAGLGIFLQVVRFRIRNYALQGNGMSNMIGVNVTSTSSVPEPSTYGLMLIGFGFLGLMMAMRKRLGLGIPQAS